MDYKKINKAKEKVLKKNEKIAAKEAKKQNNTNLPAKEEKGIKKFFRKWAVRLGLTGALAASIFSVGKSIEGNQSVEDNNNKLEDNADRLKVDTDKKINDFMDELGVDTRDLAEFVDGDGKKLEVETEIEEETTNELKEELANQTVAIDEKYEAPQAVVIPQENAEKAKEEVGLEESETTPIESVIATEKNDEVTFNEQDIVETITQEETTESKQEVEEETTQVVIEREEEKPDVIVEVNDGAQVTVEDGTIKIEDASETIVIENEEETTKEAETVVFENKNPFEEDELDR